MNAQRTKIETFNQLLQIVAILGGGTWAASVFIYSVLPSLNTNVVAVIEIESSWFEPRQTCLYSIAVSASNLSKRSSVIERIDVTGTWSHYPESPQKGHFTSIFHGADEEQMIPIGPTNEKGEVLALFEGEKLKPQAESWQSFEIFSPENPGEFIYIEARIQIEGEQDQRWASAWAPSCTSNKHEPGKTQSKK